MMTCVNKHHTKHSPAQVKWIYMSKTYTKIYVCAYRYTWTEYNTIFFKNFIFFIFWEKKIFNVIYSDYKSSFKLKIANNS